MDVANWLRTNEPDGLPNTLDEVRALSRRNNLALISKMHPSLIPASEIEHRIDGPAGSLRVRVLRPAGDGPHPTAVYFHGGGWVLGDIDTHLGHARRICRQARAVVVSVDIPAARPKPASRPRSTMPSPRPNGWPSNLDALGGNDILIVAGDSAGAQLAASVAIARRDAGLPLAAQLLLYPVTDAAGRYVDEAINAHLHVPAHRPATASA